MHLSKHKRQMTAKMNMTPMIDIVFLLIIFFMTVTQVSEANKEQLNLPKQQGSSDQESTNLTINVNQAGDIVVSGTTYNTPQLVALLTQEIAKVDNDPNRLKVVLRADQLGDSETVNEVVETLAQLGVVRVNIAVQTEG